MKASELTFEERVLYAPLWKAIPAAIVLGCIIGVLLNMPF